MSPIATLADCMGERPPNPNGRREEPIMSVAAPVSHRKPSGLVAVNGRTFPLVASRLRGRAQGGMAVSTLSQEYVNPHAEPLEVLYTMPLPADGAVLGYTIHLGESRIVTGQIQSREKARRCLGQKDEAFSCSSRHPQCRCRGRVGACW